MEPSQGTGSLRDGHVDGDRRGPAPGHGTQRCARCNRVTLSPAAWVGGLPVGPQCARKMFPPEAKAPNPGSVAQRDDDTIDMFEQEKELKVIFLDIDGVLNSHRSAVAFGGYPHHAADHRGKFDEVAVRLIRGIAKAAGAKVVLSSSWRCDPEWREIGNALGIPLLDRTPSMLGPRGKEIAAWLDNHPEVERYAIVDDDGDMLPEQMPYFVHTTHQDGLTFGCAEKLAELMGIKIWDVNYKGQRGAVSTFTLEWEA